MKQRLAPLSLNSRIMLLVGLLTLGTVALTTLLIRWTTLRIVEDAIGDQMVVQARITSHLVAIAEQGRDRGLSPAEVNEHLAEIARFARTERNYDYEFWVTDSAGKVLFGTVPTDFVFKPEQPQAGVFLRLLNDRPDHTDVIVQDSRTREIDSSTFKYVGVSGVDQPRIVQVGYRTDSLLHEVAVKSALQAAGVAGFVLAACVVAYFVLRRLLTVPLHQLISAARAVESETYRPGLLAEVCARRDELGGLARVFEDTVGKLSARYDSLVNVMRSIVLKVRGDGVITFANGYASELLGFDNAELVGRPLAQIVPQEWHGEIERRLGSLKPDEVQANETNENVSKSGRRIWIAWTNCVIKAGTGKNKELLCVGNDVTAEMAQRLQLQAREQQFRDLLEATPDALIISDEAGKIVLINAQTERLLGYARSELVGQPIELLVPERVRAGHPERRRQYFANPTVRGMGSGRELTAVRKDGSEFPVEVSLSPLHGRDGRGTLVCSSLRDISERKRHEAELKRINFLADTALELTRAGYWHVPLDGSGWYNSSERAARIFGDPPRPDHRYLIDHWAAHVKAGDETAAKTTLENFTAAVAGTIPAYDATYAYKRPVDGRTVWIHALGHVVKNAAGRPTDMFGVTQDVTEFKHLEADLRKAMKKAEEATVAKSAFLANMSHEIRTPMNGIMGMTELALDTDLTEEQRDYLNTVKSSADALLSLINDILDFSKIEAGRIELDPIDFLIRDSISDTLNPLSLRASSKGVELAYEVQPEVPDALIGDIYRIRQVLVNLVGNAIKFTQRGEVIVSVGLQERHGDDLTLRISVRDTGIGIDAAAAARLFRPFEQAETSTTRTYGGTGLGLAISRQLVELMGGGISLESTPGVGSTFAFSIRLKAGVQRPSSTAEDAARVFQGKTALIVDDNETNRRILSTMLGNWGLHSVAADSARTALATLDRATNAGQPISVILTDLHMPEMDGFEFVAALRSRANYTNLPVLLLTSSASSGDTARCTELSIAVRLLKPVKQSLLLDNLMKALAGASRLDTPAPRPASVPDDAAAPGRALRVLLAEDNAVNQKFAVRLLSGAGHDVQVANNGREAIEQWAAGGFDVVLMDVQMPEMDGLDATRAIRARETGSPRRIPIIAMTANAMAGDREMCLEAGMDGYVPKPVRKELLFAEISRLTRESDHGR